MDAPRSQQGARSTRADAEVLGGTLARPHLHPLNLRALRMEVEVEDARTMTSDWRRTAIRMSDVCPLDSCAGDRCLQPDCAGACLRSAHLSKIDQCVLLGAEPANCFAAARIWVPTTLTSPPTKRPCGRDIPQDGVQALKPGMPDPGGFLGHDQARHAERQSAACVLDHSFTPSTYVPHVWNWRRGGSQLHFRRRRGAARRLRSLPPTPAS